MMDKKLALHDGTRVFFGDLHVHTANSFDVFYPDDGSDPLYDGPEEALSFAADPLHGDLDFASITDHSEAFDDVDCWSEKDIIERFQKLLELCRLYKDNNNLIVFPGFEYSNSEFPSNGNTGFGNKCIIMYHPDYAPPRPIPSTASSNSKNIAFDISELWSEMDASPAFGKYISIPHHPARGILYENGNEYFMASDWSSAGVSTTKMPLVEIYSVNGSSEAAGCEEPVKGMLSEYTVAEALRKWLFPPYNPAYKIGIIASTDNHIAKPGSVDRFHAFPRINPGRKLYGGLAAILSKSKSRIDFWNALLSKRCYATTGARIAMDFMASGELGKTVPMGGTINIGKKEKVTLHIEAAADPKALGSDGGPAGIKRIEIIRDTLEATKIFIIDDDSYLLKPDVNGRIAFSWTDDCLRYERAIYRLKIYQDTTQNADQMIKNGEWDEKIYCPYHRAWSSPVWIERK